MVTVPARNYRANKVGKLASPLPDGLVRRNPPARGTRHNLRRIVPNVVDKAVNVLEKTDCALALQTFFDRASDSTPDRTARRPSRLSA